MLPPGGYIVHASMGHAHTLKKVQLRAETVREVFEIPAGGIRIEGKVGDARIPSPQIHFDVYKGSQFETGDKRPLTQNVVTGEVMLVPEGTYHIVSHYGDGNAVVRSDIRVQAARVTDVTVNHRAAIVTLKLVVRQWRRGARQYAMVGADAGRRRHQGIDRRVSACGSGGRRLSCDRAQRRALVPARLQCCSGRRPRNRGGRALNDAAPDAVTATRFGGDSASSARL